MFEFRGHVQSMRSRQEGQPLHESNRNMIANSVGRNERRQMNRNVCRRQRVKAHGQESM
jgi:hypothetical protein